MYFISAVIITKNEEDNIARCIKAIQNIADEVVVIDNFSEDKTVEISKSVGAKVYQKEWEGFGKQKNFGVRQASHDNILALDADEIPDEEAIEEIKTLKASGLKGVYEFKMMHNYFGKFLKHGLETPEYKKRLFNKTIVTWNDNLLHEGLIIPEDYPVIKLKGVLKHYSYPTIQKYLRKANLYTTIGAEQLYKRGKRNYFFKLIFSPPFVFFKAYVLKLGFLDGLHGLIAASLSSRTNFIKYAKLWELVRNNKSMQA